MACIFVHLGIEILRKIIQQCLCVGARISVHADRTGLASGHRVRGCSWILTMVSKHQASVAPSTSWNPDLIILLEPRCEWNSILLCISSSIWLVYASEPLQYGNH